MPKKIIIDPLQTFQCKIDLSGLPLSCASLYPRGLRKRQPIRVARARLSHIVDIVGKSRKKTETPRVLLITFHPTSIQLYSKNERLKR